MCRIGPQKVDITALWNYKCSHWGWDPGRIDVCAKRIITMQKCTIFNPFKNKPHY